MYLYSIPMSIYSKCEGGPILVSIQTAYRTRHRRLFRHWMVHGVRDQKHGCQRPHENIEYIDTGYEFVFRRKFQRRQKPLAFSLRLHQELKSS